MDFRHGLEVPPSCCRDSVAQMVPVGQHRANLLLSGVELFRPWFSEHHDALGWVPLPSPEAWLPLLHPLSAKSEAAFSTLHHLSISPLLMIYSFLLVYRRSVCQKMRALGTGEQAFLICA